VIFGKKNGMLILSALETFNKTPHVCCDFVFDCAILLVAAVGLFGTAFAHTLFTAFLRKVTSKNRLTFQNSLTHTAFAHTLLRTSPARLLRRIVRLALLVTVYFCAALGDVARTKKQ
jgi:hypothetical protein